MTTDYENDPFAVEPDIDWSIPADQEIEEDKKDKKKKKKKEKKAKKEKKPKEKLAINGILALIAVGLIAAVIAIDVLFVAGNVLKPLLMLIPIIGQLIAVALGSIMWVVRFIAFFAQALPILGALGLAITALIISLANKKLTPGQKKVGITWAILALVAVLAYVLLSGIIKAVLFIVLLVAILVIATILGFIFGGIMAILSALLGMF